MPRARVLLVMAGLAGALLVPVGADHAQSAGTRTVSFDHVGGNEWWAEVRLGGEGAQATRVQAMDDGGPWVDLQKRSWGAWAASFHIEPGHRVMFRATWSDGLTQDSCWFTHPGGLEQCATTPPPPPTSGPVFDHKGGNEWWVEAAVSGSPTGVSARDDGGAWVALEKKDWGNWAGSFRIEPGHKVQFRATTAGGVVESCWFTHPGGLTPTGTQMCGAASTPPPPPTAFTATFSGVKGNAYWVEAKVAANEPVASVAARADGGAWRPLTLRSWGAWAASIPLPDGSLVQLRACNGAGACVQSDTYLWPGATVANWPVEGSYATYHAHWHDGSPAGDVYDSYTMTATFRYTSGTWQVTCTGTDHWHDEYATPTDVYEDWTATASFAPPMWPTNVAIGQEVTDDVLGRCARSPFTTTVVSDRDEEVGEGRFAPSWQGYYEPCPCQAYEADWARHHGILLDYAFSGMGSGYFGELVETDAPIGLHA